MMEVMKRRIAALQATIFQPDRGSADAAACAHAKALGGFYGPWLP